MIYSVGGVLSNFFSLGMTYTGCLTTWGHYYRSWFPRSLWSKVHINMCPILDGYGVTGIFNPRTRPRVNRVWTSWPVMYSTWWLIFCVASVICACWLVQFTTEWQPVLRPAVAFSKTSFKHRSIQIKGNFTKLTSYLYFKCIVYCAAFYYFVPFIVNNRYLLF